MKYLEPDKVKYIVIHCSATKTTRDTTPREIDQWHRQRGFEMIGYHVYIDSYGNVEWGRPLFYQGAHVKGWNHCSVGVCLEGGLDENGITSDTRTVEQSKALAQVLRYLRKRFPQTKIIGHNDLDKGKACPCFDAKIYNELIDQ